MVWPQSEADATADLGDDTPLAITAVAVNVGCLAGINEPIVLGQVTGHDVPVSRLP